MSEHNMDRRDEFLKTWYTVLWSNIDRSMTSVWQIAGPIALVGGAFLAIDKLGPHLTMSLQLVIIFWALNNTMDMNVWHRRNLIFAARVERRFLNETDYGGVIASSFREPKKDWINFYKINFMTFAALFLTIMVVYAVTLSRMSARSLCFAAGPLALFVLGVILTFLTYQRCETQVDRYLKETRGEDPQGR